MSLLLACKWQRVAICRRWGRRSLSARCEVCLDRISEILLTASLRMMLGMPYLNKAYLIRNILFERGASVLPTFVIGLREGLEASLIVGIIAAFLLNQGRREALRQVWAGVAAAVALCLAIGIGLQVLSAELPQRQQEGLETVVGLFAVAMVTYMIIWMRRHSRQMKSHLEGAAAGALESGSARARGVMAFLAVLRGGFETAVFLLATFQASSNASASAAGAVLGIVVAVVLGYAIYRGGAKINMARFFRATGLVLVIVAAGLV